MKLEIHGSNKKYFAHGEYAPGIDPPLAPCPFCGSTDIRVENTHTPYYQAECDGCEAIGPAGRPSLISGRNIKTKGRCEMLHREAFAAAIEAWNTRE